MNEKQQTLIDLAKSIADMDISPSSRASIAFGITLAATRLGGASAELDDVWRDLEMQNKAEIEAKIAGLETV